MIDPLIKILVDELIAQVKAVASINAGDTVYDMDSLPQREKRIEHLKTRIIELGTQELIE